MTISELIRTLADQDVRISVRNGALSINAPAGVITPDIKHLLAERKQEIIDFFSRHQPDSQVITSRKNSNAVTLSCAQQRLWFLHHLDNDSGSHYNMCCAFNITGNLNINALAHAFQTIIHRHESLRTVFKLCNNKPMQVITRFTLTVAVIAIKAADANAWLTAQHRYVFDLTKGPLIAVKILRLSPQQHMLLMNIHHSVSDGWSMSNIASELSVLYTGYLSGNACSLSPLAFQYGDFTLWQQQWLQSRAFEQQLRYWTKQLQGAPALLTLATDRPRPAVQRYRGKSVSFVLPGALTRDLKRFILTQHSTLYITLLAAYMVLLARYSGQYDICVGSPVANRHQPGLEKLIGLFVNTLVLRASIDDTLSVTQFLQQVKETALAAFEHQHMPFERLVETINPERTLSYSPLFQVFFSLHNELTQTLNLPGLTVKPIETTSPYARFDLSLDVIEHADTITGHVQYDCDLFHHATASRLVQHYQVLLKQMIANPAAKLRDLSLLTNTQLRQILKQWNNTQVDLPMCCTHFAFEQKARQTPMAIAAVYEGEHITYDELNKRSNKLAHYLIAQGAGTDMVTGLYMEHSLELIIALLGVLKSGGAYVPLNCQMPRQRIDFIVNDSQCQHIITSANTVLKKGKLPQFCFQRQWHHIAMYCDKNPAITVTPQNLAYIIYTSGSTGTPKGVMISHGAFSNQLNWMKQTFAINCADKILFKTPLIFDIACWEWALPLLTNAMLVIARCNIQQQCEQLITCIKEQGISIIQVVPSLLTHLLTSDNIGHINALKYLFCVGEILPVNVYNTWMALNFNTVLCNIYGPTETTICSTCWVSDGNTYPLSIPIGTAIYNTRIYILDQNLNPVPPGCTGEIFIAGHGLARGYVNNPGQSAQQFIPDPFSDNPGARLYRTGDLARFLTDGIIEFSGRADYQVKIRGRRIELTEIDHALQQQPDVKEAAVIVHTRGGDTGAEQQLVACVSTFNHRDVQQEMLQSRLLTVLPQYMIPTRFVFMHKLPLTATGKIDRVSLAEHIACEQDRPVYTGAHTQTEHTLIAIWAKTLNLCSETIGINDNFFDLGGHSLLASQMINEVNHCFNTSFAVRDLFALSTVKKLAHAIAQSIGNQSTNESTTSNNDKPALYSNNMQTVNESNGPKANSNYRFKTNNAAIYDNRCALTAAQRRLWQIHQHSLTSNDHWNMVTAFRFQGQLSVAVLHKACEYIVQRHQCLRTVFQQVDGEPVQVIAGHTELQLPVITVTHAELSGYLLAAGKQVFNLSKGPLFKLTLLRLSGENFVFVINMHHIISDACSLAVLSHEITASYYDLSRDKTPRLPALNTAYSDFVRWQQQRGQAGEYEANHLYWRNQLNNAVIDLTPLQTAPGVCDWQHIVFNSHAFLLPRQLQQQLQHLARAKNVTLFVILITAFTLLLARSKKQNDICVLFDDANRQQQAFNNIIGLFANTLVLRTQIHLPVTFSDLLNTVQSTVLSATEHQNIAFTTLMQLVKPDYQANHPSLFQTAFALQYPDHEALSVPGLAVSPVSLKNRPIKVNLGMSITATSETLSGELIYNTACFCPDFIDNQCTGYIELLQEMCTAPDATLTL